MQSFRCFSREKCDLQKLSFFRYTYFLLSFEKNVIESCLENASFGDRNLFVTALNLSYELSLHGSSHLISGMAKLYNVISNSVNTTSQSPDIYKPIALVEPYLCTTKSILNCCAVFLPNFFVLLQKDRCVQSIR